MINKTGNSTGSHANAIILNNFSLLRHLRFWNDKNLVPSRLHCNTCTCKCIKKSK